MRCRLFIPGILAFPSKSVLYQAAKVAKAVLLATMLSVCLLLQTALPVYAEAQPIQIDAITEYYNSSSSPYEFTHTCSGKNRLLVVSLCADSGDKQPSAVSFGGQSLTLAKEQQNTDKGKPYASIWYLVNPTTTPSTTVAITMDNDDKIAASAISLTGVDQINPIDGAVSAMGSATTATVDVTTSTAGDLVIDVMASTSPLADNPAVVGSGQTERWREEMGGSGQTSHEAVGSTEPGATGTVTMSWTNLKDGEGWAICAMNINSLWFESYSDSSHATQSDYFDDYGNEHTVYMWGTGFRPSTAYRVIFWDQVDSTWYNRDTVDVTSTAGGELGVAGTNPIAHTFVSGTDTDGNWHCTVYDDQSYSPSTYDSGDSKLVADDTSYTGGYAFYVVASAIPEFPTIFAALTAAGLCFGIYWWMRKRRLAYVKA